MGGEIRWNCERLGGGRATMKENRVDGALLGTRPGPDLEAYLVDTNP